MALVPGLMVVSCTGVVMEYDVHTWKVIRDDTWSGRDLESQGTGNMGPSSRPVSAGTYQCMQAVKKVSKLFVLILDDHSHWVS